MSHTNILKTEKEQEFCEQSQVCKNKVIYLV